jgi:hypothetical protein
MASFKCSINQTDWQSGFNAGQQGRPDTPPRGVDGLAWVSGYIEGKAAGQIKANLKSAATLALEINNQEEAA